MQTQDVSGDYDEPKPLDFDVLSEALKKKSTKRVIVFAAYGDDGKPTPELRRAWRRHLRG